MKLKCLSPGAQDTFDSFFKGNLPTVSTTTLGASVPATLPVNNCTEKEFVCRASGHCIQMIQKCDFRPDCFDKSDESACGEWIKSCSYYLMGLKNIALAALFYLCAVW